ncbi:MAG: FHA domain-containing protein [Coriobacteriales bacterium]|nr:FHA domain-containing protein [Coriobacteriales bacterium]
MNEIATCPVCNQPVDPAGNACSCCGFMLIGITQELPSPGTAGIPSRGTIHRGKPTLTVTKGPLQGQIFDLDPLPVVIGRDPECDLFLNNMTVSRRHAIIEKKDEKLVLKDLGSLNGTWIDGKVTDRAELTDGTLVQIGTFSMRFHS